MDNENDLILDWQKTRNPVAFSQLALQYQPIVNSVVNKYRTTGTSQDTLRVQATTQLIKALKTYDPDMGAQPSTHIWNNMQKVQRTATESLSSGRMPESRSLKRSMFVTVRDNLTDRLGYEPNTDEIADELKWDRNEVSRMTSELGGEVTASRAAFDFYGNSLQVESKDKALLDYMYHDLEGKQKSIFEYTYGLGGKPVLNNKDIARKMNTNEMAIHRAKKSMAEKLKGYR